MQQAIVTPTLTLPPHASRLRRLVAGLRALNILKDEPGDPDYSRLLHLSFDHETYLRIGARMRGDVAGRAMLDDMKTLPGDTSFAELAALPEGTLGHAYARYFEAMAITPFDYDYALSDDAELLAKRYRETHDIHHIVTGYGIDDLGEVELQAFYFGNLGLRHAGFIAVTWMFVAFAQGGFRGVRASYRRLRTAFRRGKQSRMLLEVPFEAYWARPIEDIAAEIIGEGNRAGASV